MSEHRAPDDTAPYPEPIIPPTSPEETRALLHAMVEALPDEAADALCCLLARCSGPGGARAGDEATSATVRTWRRVTP